VQDEAMFGGRRIRNREYMADTRGFIAELAAKCMTPEQLGAPFTSADRQKLLEYLRQFGELDERYRYRGTARAGLVSYDYTAPEQLKQPLDAQELLHSGFMYVMAFGENADQSAMMMEPVGGMDRVVAGFMAKVGKHVKLRSQVESVRVNDNGVEVVYRSGGERTQLQADYCLNCIPLHIMAGIDNNFPADYARGLGAIQRGHLFKIGLQMKERFWEREGIYGGISWTMQDIAQVWYPAHGIHRRKGVMLAAYTFSRETGEKFASMTHAQRVEAAIQQGEKLHPGYRDYVESSVSIPWARMNHMQGCSSQWDDDLRQQWFKRLQSPLGAHYLIGDQISYHPGWQEGAIHSAYNAMADIDRRVRGVYTTSTEAVGA
jgi:monoamine oxidase